MLLVVSRLEVHFDPIRRAGKMVHPKSQACRNKNAQALMILPISYQKIVKIAEFRYVVWIFCIFLNLQDIKYAFYLDLLL